MIAMARIRAFEETLAEAHEQDKLVGGVHLAIGQEATAAGFAGLLRDGDQITTSHRGHHHMVARGLDPRRLYAEIQGRATGYCRGKGGSMHVSSFEDGVAGANGVVAGGIPMTWGLSVAAKERGDGTVAICFFGDGAANQGVLYETLNLAACWALPDRLRLREQRMGTVLGRRRRDRRAGNSYPGEGLRRTGARG